MKKAYTLAEVLICVGIIGVLAAILLPLANKFKPDSNKAIYIKTYDAIVDIVKSMASNNNLYPIVDSQYNYNKAPLYNLTQVKAGGNTYGGDKAKFCQLFALNFPTVGDISCSSDVISYSESSFDTPTFKTSQGMSYIVSTDTDLTTTYQTDIYFDINGKEKGDNCIYDADKCKNPDRFKLIVTGDGHVIPADPMGIEYLKTRMNWRKTNLTPDGTILASVPDEWKVKPEVLQSSANPESETDKGNTQTQSDENGTLTLVLGKGQMFNPLTNKCQPYEERVVCPYTLEAVGIRQINGHYQCILPENTNWQHFVDYVDGESINFKNATCEINFSNAGIGSLSECSDETFATFKNEANKKMYGMYAAGAIKELCE